MFATLDNHTSRFVQARRIDAAGNAPFVIPAQLQPLVTRVCVVPTQANLDRLASKVNEMSAANASSSDGNIEVSLYHIQVDPQRNYLTSQKWLTSTVHE